jgi:DtxR family transcriptional regulator, Mn-dependent transcriptional regulator
VTMMPTVLTQATQDYLKAIYTLSRRRGPVSVRTTDLAQRLRVSPASATNMVKRLARLRLVEHTPYRSIGLTDAGEKVALEIIRHHRLIELFLRTHLGLPLDHVHGEAEALEHVLSEEVESRIAAVLANPVLDHMANPFLQRGTGPPPSDVGDHCPFVSMHHSSSLR